MDEAQVKIAMITFAFDNSTVIKYLKDRGKAINNENWHLLDQANKFIMKKVSSDQKFLDKMQRPVSVFITLETEEGYNRAVMYN